MSKQATPRDFRGLSVWRKSHELATAVYKATSGFPLSEQYGLTSQLRRSAVSIPSTSLRGSISRAWGSSPSTHTITLSSPCGWPTPMPFNT
ncbi:MAG: four helix bundle protein [Chloroflexi bacterium]|nr:four helix bundle protein [Chloroflexota bacterium]